MGHSSLIRVSDELPERSLLATVVLLAINDACSTPPKPDKNKNRLRDTPAGLRMSRDAFTAMRFLFDTKHAGLEEYSLWLDFDAGSFRNKLHEIMADNGPNQINGFDATHRRNFRYNYLMWRKAKDMADVPEEEESEDAAV
jgi:hypothetical protein